MKTQHTTMARRARFLRHSAFGVRRSAFDVPNPFPNPFPHPSAFACGVDAAQIAAPKCSEGGRMGKGRGRDGFTLIEIMVAIALLVLIILGLTIMFDQTQKALRLGMSQTDQMEGARMVTDQLQRDIEQMEPSYMTNTVNFFADIPNYTPMTLSLPSSSAARTNILNDLYFVSRVNQTWSGIGYFVRTNPSIAGVVDPVGTLYRFQTNMPVGLFNSFPLAPYSTFLSVSNSAYGSSNFTNNVISKVLDGVVEFHVRCYDTNGVLLTGNSVISNNFFSIRNSLTLPSEVQYYAFSNNIVPAYVELELGIMEQPTLRTYNSIPNATARLLFLTNHIGNVQVFRQRIPIRNVDPSAYHL